jgi:hypothetical protein
MPRSGSRSNWAVVATAVTTLTLTLAPISALMPAAAVAADAPDPFASNFGVYPPADSNPPPFEGPYKFRKLSHDYPAQPPDSRGATSSRRAPSPLPTPPTTWPG